MKKKSMFFLLLAVFAAVFISGCKQNVGTPEDNPVSEETEDEGETEDRLTQEGRVFGISMPDLSVPYYQVLRDSVKSAVEEEGGQVSVKDAGGDPVQQNTQIQELIDEGVDLVFVCPADPSEITSALEALDGADIPVVNLSTRVENTDLVEAYIGADDYNAGKVCGDDLKLKFPDGGKIAIVESPSVDLVNERITGFEEAVSNSGFEVAARIDVEGDMSVIESGLAQVLAEGDLDAIMCGDDKMALEVLDVLEETGRNDVLVYSVGGAPDIKAAIADYSSPMEGTGALSPINMGKTAAKTAMAVLDGSVYEAETYVETFFINRDNIDMYGTDGWQ
ncbi:substrate-binding domain-containing protein [Ruminococcus sp. CLA-AA-H200]|uniref:Substrate-binding domain-containing protein n=1 Tax=Ruminococcus turbiniformis TaxID=2881258 RepID=A0ABS8FZC2_9FIRM|nr:substrate-binding domain-containing protein [Ruminococcus turbiniformis]MCC2254039.1 substrate-binding domain-containing protein [Ruminococcus turbiniformis]